MAEPRQIKLRALDRNDLEVISACLQDSLIPLREVAFLKKEGRFVMVANRFKWELGRDPARQETRQSGADAPGADASFEDDETEPPFERTNCGVCFDRVRHVRFRGVNLSSKNQILNLLAIECGAGTIDLVFSDDAAIRLDVSAISCHLEDLGEPWLTRWHPVHDLDEDAEQS